VALQALGLARLHALQLARELGILAAKRAHAIWEVRRRLDAAYFRRPPPPLCGGPGGGPSGPSSPDDPTGRASSSDSAGDDCDGDDHDSSGPPPSAPNCWPPTYSQASPLVATCPFPWPRSGPLSCPCLRASAPPGCPRAAPRPLLR
jgi:hypothetical protein